MLKTLVPFSVPPYPIQIDVDFNFRDQNLELTYLIKGDIHRISLLDQPKVNSIRTHELWKDTCFEWFLRTNQLKKYWEFNAAPTGPWNFYELDDYRTNLTECAYIQNPIFTSEIKSESSNRSYFEHSVVVSLKNLFDKNRMLLINSSFAVTSVIRWKTGETSYFSLKHPSEKADFHSLEGFQIFFPENKP